MAAHDFLCSHTHRLNKKCKNWNAITDATCELWKTASNFIHTYMREEWKDAPIRKIFARKTGTQVLISVDSKFCINKGADGDDHTGNHVYFVADRGKRHIRQLCHSSKDEKRPGRLTCKEFSKATKIEFNPSITNLPDDVMKVFFPEWKPSKKRQSAKDMPSTLVSAVGIWDDPSAALRRMQAGKQAWETKQAGYKRAPVNSGGSLLSAVAIKTVH